MIENETKEGKEKSREIEKLRQEINRSKLVAEMKKAHRIIEKIESNRKTKTIFSLCKRLHSHMTQLHNSIRTSIAFMKKMDDSDPEKYPAEFKDEIIEGIQIYESIRYDFQKSMQLTDKDMEILFPKIEVHMDDMIRAHSNLGSIISQEIQMFNYCERVLP
jgi:hypothetical protein